MTPPASPPHVVLIGPELEENLSLRHLASALLQSGVTADILAFDRSTQLPALVETVLAARPLLVGLSLAFQWRAPDMLALAVALRERGYRGHLTAGGHFGTFAADQVLREFEEMDSVCRQEAEETLVELVQALATGAEWRGIDGLTVRLADGTVHATAMRPAPDLARLPWPDRRGVPAQVFGHGIAPLVSTRGCYANCTFCSIAAWHEQATPGKRYRERPLTDVADEMAALHHRRGTDIFVFHDDNFFLPGWKANLERLSRLADLLDERGVKDFASVIKARPTDVHREVFRVLVERLHCVRAYVGIETDADQGRVTLRRGVRPRENARALKTCAELGLFVSFNMLLFDPDTTVESLTENLDFMDTVAEHPFNFGRVELYAGTPLLARMQRDGRVRGDWLQWDYTLKEPAVERTFQMAMTAFEARNFGTAACAHTMMGVRFDVEACRRFHPEAYRAQWVREAKALSAELGHDSVRGLNALLRHATRGDARDDLAVAQALAQENRALESRLTRRAQDLAREVAHAIGRGPPLTELGDPVATPLQPTHPLEARP